MHNMEREVASPRHITVILVIGRIFRPPVLVAAFVLYLAFLIFTVVTAKAQENSDGWQVRQLTDGTLVEERVSYMLTDHLGSTDAVVMDDGMVMERADYLPYGEDRYRADLTPEQVAVEEGTEEMAYRFNGKERDGETGLHYYGARYYDGEVGRFLASDPWAGDLGDPQTLNKYSYVLNNPVKYVDPTGLFNKNTNEVESGDTLFDITEILNTDHGTDYSYQEIAQMNGIANPNLIRPGDIVSIGTIEANGEVWLKPVDAGVVNETYWGQLTADQQGILHYGRNYYQDGLLPTTEAGAKASFNLEKMMGDAIAHNLAGAEGNVDYRGSGSREGQQAIYDSDGNLVTTPENMGTFDFERPGSSVHLEIDVRPWLEWGNSPNDSTTRQERIGAMHETILGREALYRLGY